MLKDLTNIYIYADFITGYYDHVVKKNILQYYLNSGCFDDPPMMKSMHFFNSSIFTVPYEL